MDTRLLTFLFTDLEGSTALWERAPTAMAEALALHDRLLRAAIEQHGGHVYRTEGDAFLSSFDDPTAALQAAAALQQALATAAWPAGVALRARTAIHTGMAQARGAEWAGPTVSRTTHLLAAAHGGQVLVSAATRTLVEGALPAGLDLRDLGVHRLKDLEQPEHVHQLQGRGLADAFAPLTTLDRGRHNLPVQLTAFFGRAAECAEVDALLDQHRLVTLSGAGGAGKTRLALQVGADRVARTTDGVWLVELAALRDPALLPAAVAQAMSLRLPPDRPPLEALIDWMRARQILLLLDNCEHLVQPVAALVAAMLTRAPALRVLATSREALRVAGEAVLRVPSLPIPDEASPLAALQAAPAVQLFVDRARHARPDFTLNADNGASVARLIGRLDGIPLALELAAARVRTLSVADIEARLDRRLSLLTGGARSALPRQQTLRALLDWSHDLLTAPEQALLARLAVFTGGWDGAAARAVCCDPQVPADDLDDLLDALVDKSLVQADPAGSTTRFGMLESVRQYAGERLGDAASARPWRDGHCAHYAGLASAAATQVSGPAQAEWTARVAREHDNVRAALAHCLQDDGDRARGLGIAVALYNHWQLLGYGREGQRWLEQLLAGWPAGRDDTLLANALQALGVLAWRSGDPQTGRPAFERALALFRTLDQPQRVSAVLNNLAAMEHSRGNAAAARVLLEEAVVIKRAIGDDRGLAIALNSLAGVELQQGRRPQAVTLLREAADRFRAVGNPVGENAALINLGALLATSGDGDGAHALYERALEVARQLGDRQNIALVLGNLANAKAHRADFEGARALYEQSLAVARAIDEPLQTARQLSGLAGLALDRGDLDTAQQLLDESMALRRANGDQPGVAEALERQARLALQRGRPALAVTLAGEAHATCARLSDPRGAAAALEVAACAWAALGDGARAGQACGHAAASRARIQLPQLPYEARWQAEWHALAQAQLGASAWAVALEAGAALEVWSGFAQADADTHDRT